MKTLLNKVTKLLIVWSRLNRQMCCLVAPIRLLMFDRALQNENEKSCLASFCWTVSTFGTDRRIFFVGKLLFLHLKCSFFKEYCLCLPSEPERERERERERDRERGWVWLNYDDVQGEKKSKLDVQALGANNSAINVARDILRPDLDSLFEDLNIEEARSNIDGATNLTLVQE